MSFSCNLYREGADNTFHLNTCGHPHGAKHARSRSFNVPSRSEIRQAVVRELDHYLAGYSDTPEVRPAEPAVDGNDLPRFRSHKVVSAFQISRVEKHADGGARLFAVGLDEGTRHAKFVHVSPEYMSKHNPQVGGWYVRYPDGYESWSPHEAFCDGYSPVTED